MPEDVDKQLRAGQPQASHSTQQAGKNLAVESSHRPADIENEVTVGHEREIFLTAIYASLVLKESL